MVLWFVPFLVGIALSVVSYLLAPKPKSAKPEAAQQADNPTADAGREIPVVFGTMTVTSPNSLWFGDKTLDTSQVDA